MSRSVLGPRSFLNPICCPIARMPISSAMYAAGVTYRLRFWGNIREAFDVLETVYGPVKDFQGYEEFQAKSKLPETVSQNILQFVKGEDQTAYELKKFKSLTEPEVQQRIYNHARFQARELRGLYQQLLQEEGGQFPEGQLYHRQPVGFGYVVRLVGSYMPGLLDMEISQEPEPTV